MIWRFHLGERHARVGLVSDWLIGPRDPAGLSLRIALLLSLLAGARRFC